MNITAEQKLIFEGKVCPYCKRPSKYVNSDIVYCAPMGYGMVYFCEACMAWVGVHKGEPFKALGRLANAELREWKKRAHASFDKMWRDDLPGLGPIFERRGDAYAWLSETLNIPPEYTHIGMFGVETCKKLVQKCDEYYKFCV